MNDRLFRSGIFFIYNLSNCTQFAVPLTSVQGVFGRQAMLPCDITPMERDDAVFMVLWYREDNGDPIYK